MSTVDNELVSCIKYLSEKEAEDIREESCRLNNEYLENSLMLAKVGQRAVVESVQVKGNSLLPKGANPTQSVGMNISMLPGNRTFYIFAFPDGSWFSHNLVANTLVYAGDPFIWDTFLAKHFTTPQA